MSPVSPSSLRSGTSALFANCGSRIAPMNTCGPLAARPRATRRPSDAARPRPARRPPRSPTPPLVVQSPSVEKSRTSITFTTPVEVVCRPARTGRRRCRGSRPRPAAVPLGMGLAPAHGADVVVRQVIPDLGGEAAGGGQAERAEGEERADEARTQRADMTDSGTSGTRDASEPAMIDRARAPNKRPAAAEVDARPDHGHRMRRRELRLPLARPSFTSSGRTVPPCTSSRRRAATPRSSTPASTPTRRPAPCRSHLPEQHLRVQSADHGAASFRGEPTAAHLHAARQPHDHGPRGERGHPRGRRWRMAARRAWPR